MRSSERDMIARARVLRRAMTPAERRLWARLRGRRCAGAHFRRQAPAGPFIVDFLCRAARLVVEVDGASHAPGPGDGAASARDAGRTRWLEAEGYRVLRFWNHEVVGNTAGVVAVIEAALAEQRARTASASAGSRPPPRPSP